MWWAVSLRPILRDARLWRAPQDEVLFRGEILDPHGEERRLRRVSNHEAEHVHSLQSDICDCPACRRVGKGASAPCPPYFRNRRGNGGHIDKALGSLAKGHPASIEHVDRNHED